MKQSEIVEILEELDADLRTLEIEITNASETLLDVQDRVTEALSQLDSCPECGNSVA